MDAPSFNGDDDRDGLTQRSPNSPAAIAPTCQRCGFVVYKVGARLSQGVMCPAVCRGAEGGGGMTGKKDDDDQARVVSPSGFVTWGSPASTD